MIELYKCDDANCCYFWTHSKTTSSIKWQNIESRISFENIRFKETERKEKPKEEKKILFKIDDILKSIKLEWLIEAKFGQFEKVWAMKVNLRSDCALTWIKSSNIYKILLVWDCLIAKVREAKRDSSE